MSVYGYCMLCGRPMILNMHSERVCLNQDLHALNVITKQAAARKQGIPSRARLAHQLSRLIEEYRKSLENRYESIPSGKASVVERPLTFDGFTQWLKEYK